MRPVFVDPGQVRALPICSSLTRWSAAGATDPARGTGHDEALAGVNIPRMPSAYRKRRMQGSRRKFQCQAPLMSSVVA